MASGAILENKIIFLEISKKNTKSSSILPLITWKNKIKLKVHPRNRAKSSRCHRLKSPLQLASQASPPLANIPQKPVSKGLPGKKRAEENTAKKNSPTLHNRAKIYYNEFRQNS